MSFEATPANPMFPHEKPVKRNLHVVSLSEVI
jgi:hypothetical protein